MDFFLVREANLIQMFISGMKPEHVKDDANHLLQVKLRQRTWQKYKRLLHTCKELLLLTNPERHTVFVCKNLRFYHSSQLQPKIFYCSRHASVTVTYGFEPAK